MQIETPVAFAARRKWNVWVQAAIFGMQWGAIFTLSGSALSYLVGLIVS